MRCSPLWIVFFGYSPLSLFWVVYILSIVFIIESNKLFHNFVALKSFPFLHSFLRWYQGSFWSSTNTFFMSNVHSQTDPTISLHNRITYPNLHPSNPYYIHSSEEPNFVTITPMLTSLSYHSWSRAIRMTLISKNKMGFFTTAITEPTRYLGTM